MIPSPPLWCSNTLEPYPGEGDSVFMTLAIVPLTPLERGQLHVIRLRALRNAIVLLVAAGAAEWFVPNLPMPGLFLAPVILLALWMVVLAPPRRWRRWGYAFTGTELHVEHGLFTRVHTIVPVLRVQHIDVQQDVLERLFKVATLVLHTAGTDDNVVILPGIARATAEAIRDTIRERIGSAAHD